MAVGSDSYLFFIGVIILNSGASIAGLALSETIEEITRLLGIVGMSMTIFIGLLFAFVLGDDTRHTVCRSLLAWPVGGVATGGFTLLIIDITHGSRDVEAPPVRNLPTNIVSSQQHTAPPQQTASRKTQHDVSVDLRMLMTKRQLEEVWREECRGLSGGGRPGNKTTLADEIANYVSQADIRKNFSTWNTFDPNKPKNTSTGGPSKTPSARAIPPPTPDISTLASDPNRPPTRPGGSAALRSSTTAASDPAWPPTRPRDTSIDPVLKWIASQSQAPTSLGGRAGVSGSDAISIPSSLKPLEFIWADTRIDKALGLGSFGKVYLAELHHTQVAIKLLVDSKAAAAASMGPSSFGSQGSALPSAPINKLLEEVTIMAALRHPNVALLVGFCIAPPCLAIELCARGSLYDVLQQATIDPAAAAELTWERAIRMAADAAAGMHHLHTRSPLILHRDLKSPNLLVAADWTVKVSDMGLSKLVNEATRNSNATAGGVDNPRWLAPELMKGKGASKASDVFSFGVVMWELLTWRLPWADTEKWHIVGVMLDGGRLPVPLLSEVPYKRTAAQERGLDASYDAYVGLMRRCWVADVAARPDFSTIAEGLRAML